MVSSAVLATLAAIGRPLLPGGARGRLSILIYHRVLPLPDPLLPGEVDAATFDWQVALLARHCHLLALPEAVERLATGSLPPGAVCITFDDGYADNATVAAPILCRHGATATFFVSTGFLDGGRMWNDTVIEAVRRAPAGTLDLTAVGMGVHALDSDAGRITAFERLLATVKYLDPPQRANAVAAIAAHSGADLPADLMMSTAQVRELAAQGMTIGAHTVDHPILARLTRAQARAQILDGRARLEAITGLPVAFFAYPNGRPGRDYLPEHVDVVRELGFAAAVSTTWGVADGRSDRWQLPRFTPWDRSPVRFLARLFWNARSVR